MSFSDDSVKDSIANHAKWIACHPARTVRPTHAYFNSMVTVSILPVKR
jgi:hypothetical protein